MCNDTLLVFRQGIRRYSKFYRKCHPAEPVQRIPVGSVELFRHKDQGLGLCDDRFTGCRIRIIDHTDIRGCQTSCSGILSCQHPQHLYMRLDISLCQLPKCGLFAGFRVVRAAKDAADVLPEFVVDQPIVLLIRYSQQVFLRGSGKFQSYRCIRYCPYISLDQPADRFFQPGLPKWFVMCGIPDHSDHHRFPKMLRGSLCVPGSPDPFQFPDICFRVEIYMLRGPGTIRLIFSPVFKRKPAFDPAVMCVPGCCCTVWGIKPDLRTVHGS